MKNYNKNSPETIQTMFGTIAKQYDLTNSILSFRMHKMWNRALVRKIGNVPTLLDLCCGTGEIAFEYLKIYKNSNALLLDFCPEMLECAKIKAKDLALENRCQSFIEGDAQDIKLDDGSVNGVSIAYGIRNVQNPSRCFNEVFRVLKPEGVFGVLELTQPKNRFLKFGHRVYLRHFLPLLGKFFASNQEAYQYLCKSIQNFTPPVLLERMLQDSGFKDTSCTPLLGGIATIILGKK